MMFFDGGRKLADGPVPLHLRRGPSILAQGEVKPSIIPFHDEVLLPLKNKGTQAINIQHKEPHHS
jgi:hypothetical protein